MIRGSLVFATLLEAAESTCPDCHFNFSALEEFSADYTAVRVTDYTADSITTGALPSTFPSERGSIAVHMRNEQLKLDNHLSFPTPFAIGQVPVSGMEVHEELHINGATGQASFHLASPIVNMCFQLDSHIPVAQMQHDMIESRLRMMEQRSSQMAQQEFEQYTVDGQVVMGDPVTVRDRVAFTPSSHPAFLFTPPDPDADHMMASFNPPAPAVLRGPGSTLAVIFENYANSVGNQFGVRACGITDHSRSQSLLAASPEARKFVVYRLAQHESRLQAVLKNTGFNFSPLEISDVMVPSAQPCTGAKLAQIPSTALSTAQTAAFSVCSFVMGLAITLTVIRKTHASSANDYHQVAV